MGNETQMPEQRIVTASLEGMRVVVNDSQCELHEYDFVVNRWSVKDEARRPLARRQAEEWLSGWNAVDRFAAMNVLTNSREADRPGYAAGQRLEPSP